MKHWLCMKTILVAVSTIAFSLNSHSAVERSISVSSGEEINVEQYPASGKHLVLWFAPEFGLRENHRNLARMLSKQGIEVWLSNIQESLFMPDSANSIKQLDGNNVADLIAYAYKTTRKKIIVSGNSYSSIIALKGAHRWQEKYNNNALTGAILFSPYTYAAIPPLGQLPEYLPVVSATNIPIMIFQTKHSAIFGQFDTLVEKLQQHGSPVYTRLIPDVMSLFYETPPTQQMMAQLVRIPPTLQKIIPVLETHDVPAKPVTYKTGNKITSGIDIHLKMFNSKLNPLNISLPDTNNNTYRKTTYQGQVTLINFWATWCPPCVEEIPSLNRLKQKMAGQPFELISINYAEDKTAIEKFMEKVDVQFPVLLDEEGEFAHKWNVITYPSTFIIDSKGKIRYGVNAAIEWDSPEIIKILSSLQ